jgi:hypothetical protein
MHEQNAASQSDIMRLQAKLAETEFVFQTKTGTFQEAIAALLDEIESLKSELQSISKIPKEKLLLWALKEKELCSQDGEKKSEQPRDLSNARELSSIPYDTSKPEKSIRHIQERDVSAETNMHIEKNKKLEIDLKEHQAQLKECQDKLRLKSEEVLLLRLKMKENGGQQRNQNDSSAYILNLEDTITSLSEELSGLKHDLITANDLSRNRLDEMSSQALLRHQKRFLSDRNALVATHGKLMMSMARMSTSFSSEIRSQLSMLRKNVSGTHDLMQSDVVEAIKNLRMYSMPVHSSLKNQQETRNITNSPNTSTSIASLATSLGERIVSEPMLPTVQAPKKERGFFSSLFSKVSQTKDVMAHPASEPVGNISATAHLKTVFAQAKGAVEAQEALQLRLAAEAQAEALDKIEKEWTTAANAKAEAASRMFKEMECNEAKETAAAEKAAAEATVAAATTEVAREKEVSDVSSFSDDGDLNFERDDEIAASHTKIEDSVALAQTIIAATLAMNRSQLSEVLNASEIAMPINVGQPIKRNVYVPKEARNKLFDRPASAEAIGSSVKIVAPSENANASFLNDIVIEDARDSLQLQGRVVSPIAEKSGRKVLAGTLKSNLGVRLSPKV